MGEELQQVTEPVLFLFRPLGSILVPNYQYTITVVKGILLLH